MGTTHLQPPPRPRITRPRHHSTRADSCPATVPVGRALSHAARTGPHERPCPGRHPLSREDYLRIARLISELESPPARLRWRSCSAGASRTRPRPGGSASGSPPTTATCRSPWAGRSARRRRRWERGRQAESRRGLRRRPWRPKRPQPRHSPSRRRRPEGWRIGGTRAATGRDGAVAGGAGMRRESPRGAHRAAARGTRLPARVRGPRQGHWALARLVARAARPPR